MRYETVFECFFGPSKLNTNTTSPCEGVLAGVAHRILGRGLVCGATIIKLASVAPADVGNVSKVPSF